MTHTLRIQVGEASISKYKEEVKKPLEPEVLETLARWIENRVRLAAKSLT